MLAKGKKGNMGQGFQFLEYKLAAANSEFSDTIPLVC